MYLRRAASSGVRRALQTGQSSAPAASAASQPVISLQQRNYQAPIKDMMFVMNDVHGAQDHYGTLKNVNGDYATPEMQEEILGTMGKFCEEVLWPMNETADREGCTYIDEKTIKTPTGFKEAYDEYKDGGWQGLSFPEEYGGQGLPMSVALMKSEMIATANWTWGMYPGLSKGAINTILAHCNDELKEKYLPPLVSSEWTGTMCLTEPHCGSDLAQVNTRAEPQDDGSYAITGTKIFISCGDHDLTDNVIHCVLARLPGAPEGTRGISLFLVPKNHVDDEGNVGEYNNTNIGRIENKMGCHGSSTCEINFEKSKGWLIGTENKGLNHMFTFINTSRLGTAIQGITTAELSFQLALEYAKERLAMRSLSGKKNPDGPADPIIVHPDVRKNLLTQKAIVEGGRSMIYECALIADRMVDAELGNDQAAWDECDDAMGFLTPILKGFLTEKGLVAANLGIQIWGGHGYIKENGMEQIVRDARISSVWEGTTGIQALDLLGRKIMLQGKLKPINVHCGKLRSYALKTLSEHAGDSQIRAHALEVLRLSVEWQYLTYRIAMNAKGNADCIGSASVDYLMYSGYCSMAHHWLQMEVAAKRGLASGEGDADFYTSKLQTGEFFFDAMLPTTAGLKQTMMADIKVFNQMPEANFWIN